ncbi:MAG TPA: SDR family NAD(P)-dependent oxidoreductase, partial [Steroidobacteraceae bacterium]|nr:SDR family NAD(P)-dependent oxidoreductase [Steroidobacteraceae bacterium]
MNANRFQGESVLVTGAASSVGRLIAERFAAEGGNVHICDVQEAALRETLAANPDIRGTVGSVGKPDDVCRIFAEARTWLDPPTILVNTVGIGGPRAPIEDVSIDDWLESFGVNVHGMFYCIREAVPAMKRAGRGVILNFSSGST